jgi:hypothetical protein
MDAITDTIELLFQYFDNTPSMVTAGESLLIAERRAQAVRVARARARWLAERHAERSFPCGFVRWEASTKDGRVVVEIFVTAVVVDASVVFLVERPYGSEGQPVEVGAIDRSAISEVTVLDLDGRELPHPASEPIDPEPYVFVAIRWLDAAGTPAEQRLLFGSSWEAWRAADKLREAMPSPYRVSM